MRVNGQLFFRILEMRVSELTEQRHYVGIGVGEACQ